MRAKICQIIFFVTHASCVFLLYGNLLFFCEFFFRIYQSMSSVFVFVLVFAFLCLWFSFSLFTPFWRKSLVFCQNVAKQLTTSSLNLTCTYFKNAPRNRNNIRTSLTCCRTNKKLRNHVKILSHSAS